MEYKICSNKIEIIGKEDFCPRHIFECGQIFSYKKLGDDTKNKWEVFSMDKCAFVEETENGYVISTKDTKYFEEFFDLKTDYSALKRKLSKFEILKKPIRFGYGIRILHQNLFETLISFIVSANNNIKRIQLILERIRKKFGTEKDGFYSFPTRNQLLQATEEDFKQLGAGYRASYLFRVLRQVDEKTLQEWSAFPTKQLREKLTTLFGVGPKVADCVLLFGYGRGDVFPVDTWIEKMFLKFYGNSIDLSKAHLIGKENHSKQVDANGEAKSVDKELQKDCSSAQSKQISREKIREFLTEEFGLLSGYAQQYLFYYMRSGDKISED